MNAQPFIIACLLLLPLAAIADAQQDDGGGRRQRDSNRGRDDDERDRRSSRGDDRSSNSSAKKSEQPLVPGFGETLGLPPVAGFGLPQGGSSRTRGQGVPLEDVFAASVIRNVDGILQRYDRNRNRMLERAEWTGVPWRNDPATSDANGDGILSREELCRRISGFEEERGQPGSSTSGNPGDDRQKLVDYAKSLMDRYDANDNGVIDQDEAQKMSGFHQGADLNGDKTITREELTDRLEVYGKSSADGPSGSTSSATKTKPATPATNGQPPRVTLERPEGPRPYRPRTDVQRLPKGLPDWFTRNDANGDGQIAMAEYSVSWSDTKLEEFRKYDLNADGVITPGEYLDAAKASTKP